MIDKEAGAFFDRIDNFIPFTGRNSRTSEASACKWILVEELVTDVIRPVNHDFSGHGLIVDAFFKSVNTKRQTVLAVVNAASNVKAKAAFVRFGLVGERCGEFAAGVPAMRHISVLIQFHVCEVDHIHPFIPGRLAEITNGEIVGINDPAGFGKFEKPSPCVAERLFVQSKIFEP